MGLSEAESGEARGGGGGGEVGEEEEEAMALGEELGPHAEKDAHEVGIDYGEVGLALIGWERGEPSEDGGSRVRVRVRVRRGEVVERDVRRKGVDELVSVHGSGRELQRRERGGNAGDVKMEGQGVMVKCLR